MTLREKQELLKFCDKLEEFDASWEADNGGQLERELAMVKTETVNKVGDLLREFLESGE